MHINISACIPAHKIMFMEENPEEYMYASYILSIIPAVLYLQA